ncbi:MAG: mechanosensitive ion channel [Marivibrio sp.]|uniref:mechanosensitive ion channel domain-containing protein n=1 Tax=Marivibrio sp. TaxID=2039719 RepID=UPI0032ED7FEA
MRLRSALAPFLLGLLTLALCAVESPRAAAQGESEQASQAASQEFSLTVAGWSRRLDRIERLLRDGGDDPQRNAEALDTLSEVRSEAQSAKSRAETALEDANARLDSLGAPPAEGEPAEPADIGERRSQINKEIGTLKSRVSLADLALTRVRSLEERLSSSERQRLMERLTTQGPLPYAPSTLTRAVQDFAALLAAMGATAVEWWANLPDADRAPERVALTLLGFIAAAFAVAFLVRRLLGRRFGARPTDDPPAYSQRLIAAIADGLGEGLMPAAILGIIAVRTGMEGTPLYSAFGDLVGLGATMAIIYVLATALPKAVLSPDYPQWRLTRLHPENAARILLLIRVIALLFCVDEFLVEATQRIDPLHGLRTPELDAVWTFLFNAAQAASVFALLRPSLWTLEDRPAEEAGQEGETAAQPDASARQDQAEAEREAAEEDDPDTQPVDQPAGLDGAAAAARAGAGAGFWKLLRFALATLAVVGLLAPVAGYTALGNYLLNNLLGTGLVVGVLYILRGLFRELIGLGASSRFMRDTLGVEHKTRARLKFWARAFMDLVVIALGVLVVAPNWGVSQLEILRWLSEAFEGFSVGNVRISVADIFFGLVTFAVILTLTSATKRALAERVLPETDIDEGVQHSVTAGVGYLGFVVAVALAIAMMGVDLSNIAIIAGALSVGIGFGLQNIVNNFVSGLILLIERPIKAGDWVVVGENEGFVRQISMRATEIETWHRASVIVPNADLLSSALKNWTHKDKYGRIDVDVGVALDSDVKQVEKVLIQIARRHPRVVRWPQPAALILDFGNSRIEFQLRVFSDDIVWAWFIASDLRYEIVRRFRDEGIVIPYDHQILHLTRGDPQTPVDENGDPIPPPRFTPKGAASRGRGAKSAGGDQGAGDDQAGNGDRGG